MQVVTIRGSHTMVTANAQQQQRRESCVAYETRMVCWGCSTVAGVLMETQFNMLTHFASITQMCGGDEPVLLL